jgi:DNA-binding IclR family transcriptional regulator
LPPIEGEASALLALLRAGDSWATSALAAAVGKSQRAVQRALAALEQQGEVRATGEGRARRWVASPAAGLATTLLLVAPGTLG